MKKIFIIYLLFYPLVLWGFDGIIQCNLLTLQIPVPTIVDLDRGYVETHANVDDFLVNINSLKETYWELYIYTEQPWFYPVELEKPHQDLLWKLSQSQDYHAVELQKNLVKSGIGNEKVKIDFRILVDWNTKPSVYSTNLVIEVKSRKQ